VEMVNVLLVIDKIILLRIFAFESLVPVIEISCPTTKLCVAEVVYVIIFELELKVAVEIVAVVVPGEATEVTEVPEERVVDVEVIRFGYEAGRPDKICLVYVAIYVSLFMIYD
jgi:hypothetical protein